MWESIREVVDVVRSRFVVFHASDVNLQALVIHHVLVELMEVRQNRLGRVQTINPTNEKLVFLVKRLVRSVVDVPSLRCDPVPMVQPDPLCFNSLRRCYGLDNRRASDTRCTTGEAIALHDLHVRVVQLPDLPEQRLINRTVFLWKQNQKSNKTNRKNAKIGSRSAKQECLQSLY